MNRRLDLLVVDDSQLLRERVLARLGEMDAVHSTIEAPDAPSARALLQSHHFDAVLLDLKLSEENGLALIVRAKMRSPSPAVIVFTTLASPKIRAACLKLGADHFLDKASGFEPVEQALAELAGRVASEDNAALPQSASVSYECP